MLDFTNWMAHPTVQKMRICDLILPGTKLSGAYKLSPRHTPLTNSLFKLPIGLLSKLSLVKNWYVTQELDIAEQLEHGIRLLDFQITYVHSILAKDGFALTNNFGFCGYKNALAQIVKFLNDHPTEIVVIIAHSDIRYHDVTNIHAADFLDLSKITLQNKLIHNHEISNKNIGAIGGRVLLVYNCQIADNDGLIQTNFPTYEIVPIINKTDNINDNLVDRVNSNIFSNMLNIITYQPNIDFKYVFTHIRSNLKEQLKKYNCHFIEFLHFLKDNANNSSEDYQKKINGFLLVFPSEEMIQEIIMLNGDFDVNEYGYAD